MQRLLILLTLLLIFTISCSGTKKKKEKKFEPVKIEDVEQQGEFKTLWTKKLADGDKTYGYQLIPYVDNKDLYVASSEGEILKLEAETGQQLWSIETEKEISAGPGVGNSILVIGSPEGEVIAYDKDNGSFLWSEGLSSEILSPPVVENNMVIVRAQDGRVYALDSENGQRKWLFDTNIPNLTLRGYSKPIVRAGRIYIGFDNGKVAAIKQETGEVIWLQNVVDTKGKTELARIVDIDGDMALISTDLYLSSAVGKTMSVATESGRVMWSNDAGSALGVTASRSNLFVLDNESFVYALLRSDGTQQWVSKTYKHRLLTKPVFHLGDILVGDLEGYIHVLDGSNGETVARTRMGKDQFYSQPIGTGSTLFAYNKDGTLTAFEYSR